MPCGCVQFPEQAGGEPAGAALATQRLHHVRQRLQRTFMRLLMICSRVGLASSVYFCKCCKSLISLSVFNSMVSFLIGPSAQLHLCQKGEKAVNSTVRARFIAID